MINSHPSGYKVLDTIGDTMIISIKKVDYNHYFAGTWEDLVDIPEGVSASRFLSELKN